MEGIFWWGGGKRVSEQRLRPPSASTPPWQSRSGCRVRRLWTGGGGRGAQVGSPRALPAVPGWTVPAGRLRVGRAEWAPRSYHELLLQLLGAGRLVLQGPAGEGAPRGAQEVQGDLPGRAHRADGLHGAQGLHVQHECYAGAPPAGTDSRAAGIRSASQARLGGALPPPHARGPGNSGTRPLRRASPAVPHGRAALGARTHSQIQDRPRFLPGAPQTNLGFGEQGQSNKTLCPDM